VAFDIIGSWEVFCRELVHCGL